MENLQPSHSLLHAFCTRSHTRFDMQGENEEVLLVVRAHPITLLSPFINMICLFVLLFVMNIFLSSFLGLGRNLFFNIFCIFFILDYFFFTVISWYYNLGIVTNERVLDVDFNIFSHKEVTYTQLSHVEDVTARSTGYLASMLNYGNVFVQTAGTESNTEFMDIPRPSDVAKLINQLASKKRHGN